MRLRPIHVKALLCTNALGESKFPISRRNGKSTHLHFMDDSHSPMSTHTHSPYWFVALSLAIVGRI